MTVSSISAAPSMRFALAARAINDAARAAGVVVPAFRTPPRRAGVTRTIRREASGTVVSVVARGRPFGAVLADMVDGVVAANDLDLSEAARLRDVLWAAVEPATTDVADAA